MVSNLDLIRTTYAGPSEENGRNLLAALTPDPEWTEAELQLSRFSGRVVVSE